MTIKFKPEYHQGHWSKDPETKFIIMRVFESDVPLEIIQEMQEWLQATYGDMEKEGFDFDPSKPQWYMYTRKTVVQECSINALTGTVLHQFADKEKYFLYVSVVDDLIPAFHKRFAEYLEALGDGQ
jgi:hypothetical protein